MLKKKLCKYAKWIRKCRYVGVWFKFIHKVISNIYAIDWEKTIMNDH